MRVEDILRVKGADVVTIPVGATVGEAVDTLCRHGIGALVVAGGAGPVGGLLAEREVIRALADAGPAALDRTVGSLMLTDVPTCAPGDHLEALMRAMTEGRIRHLPVVHEERLVGIVSIGDVVKSRLDELESENELMHAYISTGR